jgi:hypothetical protein
MIDDKIFMICGNCSSRDVVRDAWAEWDRISQTWTLAHVFDYAFCNVCNSETSIVEKVDNNREFPK